MKERYGKKVIGATLALSSALGVAACDGQSDKLKSCSSEWSISNLGTDSQVTNMAGTMAALQEGRSELVADIQSALGITSGDIKISTVPAQYQVAAALLIGRTNSYWYNTSKSKIDTPRDEFCTDNILYTVYKSPDYVNAEAALQAAGIDITPDQKP